MVGSGRRGIKGGQSGSREPLEALAFYPLKSVSLSFFGGRLLSVAAVEAKPGLERPCKKQSRRLPLTYAQKKKEKKVYSIHIGLKHKNMFDTSSEGKTETITIRTGYIDYVLLRTV